MNSRNNRKVENSKSKIPFTGLFLRWSSLQAISYKSRRQVGTPTSASGLKAKSSDGYALLLSVVVSGLILAIGLGLLGIVEKALTLSSAGRESQVAFYAADTGSECALYWDRKHEGLGTTVFATSTFSVSPGGGIFCAGVDIAEVWTVSDATTNTANTSFDLALANGACVTVTVQKTNSGRKTLVESRGHNSCSPTSPRRIERAIRISY
ncbi:MAG TPA: hypothetical protein VJB70_00555 [Candidatus Paceibacterota bacterium]